MLVVIIIFIDFIYIVYNYMVPASLIQIVCIVFSYAFYTAKTKNCDTVKFITI